MSYYEDNKERLLAKAAERYERVKNDPEYQRKAKEYRDANKAKRQKYYEDNIEYFKAKAKENYNPGAKYGITKEEYEAHLSVGKCGICGSTERLRLDHNHDTGRVRGVLCHHCNLAVGLLRDNVETLKQAITYLTRPEVS